MLAGRKRKPVAAQKGVGELGLQVRSTWGSLIVRKGMAVAIASPR
jgi:hypothetical protein